MWLLLALVVSAVIVLIAAVRRGAWAHDREGRDLSIELTQARRDSKRDAA